MQPPIAADFTFSHAAREFIAELKEDMRKLSPDDPPTVLMVDWGLFYDNNGSSIGPNVIVSYYRQSDERDIRAAIQEVDGVPLVFFTTPEYAPPLPGQGHRLRGIAMVLPPMKLHPVPPEFKRYVSYFDDIERVGIHTLDYYHTSSLSALDPGQKRRLLVYIETCLDGTHSEEELFRLWFNQSPQHAVRPATHLFSEIRRRLLEEIEAGQ